MEYSSPLYRLAKGTDASFYRLIPKKVIVVNSEDEVQEALARCMKAATPVTFKAGGTSLSGQTITDSVLMETGSGFSGYTIENDGLLATFQPGIRGGYANALLAPYGRKIGPSPASINAARIGGIVGNNASGASYGIATNSYNTLAGMRIIFSDGTLLDTRDDASRNSFRNTHGGMLHRIEALRDRVMTNETMVSKIRSKYSLKNTCGYGVNSLIDYHDPIDIIEHLMVGSEGTLGFISSVSFHTLPDHPLKASALVFFPGLREAASAIMPLRECKEVSAAELMDRNSLRAVEDNPGMPEVLKTLGENATALLIETSAEDLSSLQNQIEEIKTSIGHIPCLFPVSFTTDPAGYDRLWNVRKGLFTSVAAKRPKGTVCIIEDVAFHGETLGEALCDLQDLFAKYKYQNPVIWGHLLDGNIHFVITPDFQKEKELSNYKVFMHELADLILYKYDGSLKAEHGTGRNMAPFVEKEWGKDVYGVMKEIKSILDPKMLLNPGVILNDDPDIFASNIKPLPLAHPLIDDCIECGFCEHVCPSNEFTTTPRQRIVAYREINRLSDAGEHRKAKQLSADFSFHANQSCATDGLCALNCPVGIDTGKLMKELRFTARGSFSNRMASVVAGRFRLAVTLARLMLGTVTLISKLLPAGMMRWSAKILHTASFRKIPLWNEYMPAPAPRIRAKTIPREINEPVKKPDRKTTTKQLPETGEKVVYFPSCINRIFGVSKDYNGAPALSQTMVTVLSRAGYHIVFPENMDNLCCGMAFHSKGFKRQGQQKLQQLQDALLKASNNAEYPVVCDMSPCLLHMQENLKEGIQLYEPVGFSLKFLRDRLEFKRLPITVAIHSTCSNTKMGLEGPLVTLASLCAEEVVRPSLTGCCGWAGDKGFSLPGLNKSALKYLKDEIPPATAYGLSSSRTCEIGLSMHTGISYRSVMHLVEAASRKPI